MSKKQSKNTIKEARKIQAKTKGKVWKSEPQKPKPITTERYEAWMMEFARHFADTLVERVLAEIVETKRAKNKNK